MKMKEKFEEIIKGCLPPDIPEAESVVNNLVGNLMVKGAYIADFKIGQGVVLAGKNEKGASYATQAIIRGITFGMFGTDPNDLEIMYMVEPREAQGEIQIVQGKYLKMDPSVIGLK